MEDKRLKIKKNPFSRKTEIEYESKRTRERERNYKLSQKKNCDTACKVYLWKQPRQVNIYIKKIGPKNKPNKKILYTQPAPGKYEPVWHTNKMNYSFFLFLENDAKHFYFLFLQANTHTHKATYLTRTGKIILAVSKKKCQSKPVETLICHFFDHLYPGWTMFDISFCLPFLLPIFIPLFLVDYYFSSQENYYY